MKPQTKLLALFGLLLAAGCSQNQKEFSASSETAPQQAEVANDRDVAAAGSLALDAPDRKIIHTADISLQVKNVLEATESIEEKAKQLGGIVEHSSFNNENVSTTTRPYTKDSLQEVHIYRSVATLTLRVPDGKRDSLINALPAMASFVHSRTLGQDDVTYEYMGNELKNKASDTIKKQAIKKAKSTDDVLKSHGANKGNAYDDIDRNLYNFELMDKVNYATVTVALHQPEQAYMQAIINMDHFTRPSFSTAAANAFNTGGWLFRQLMIGLIALWPLWLVVAIIIAFRKSLPRLRAAK